MRITKKSLVSSLIALAFLSVGTFGGHAAAQLGLQFGGGTSNFGRGELRGGFLPDPFATPINGRSGSIDAGTLNIGADCRGFVTRPPDFILDYTRPGTFLRVYFVGRTDTTLVIHDSGNRWHCNDDSHGGLNPTVDLSRPREGQYDVWIGARTANAEIRGTLYVTETRSRHP